jgi:hypothetical protein
LKGFRFQLGERGVLLAHGCLGLLDGGELDEGEADGLLVFETDVLDGSEAAEHLPELFLAGLHQIGGTDELRLET